MHEALTVNPSTDPPIKYRVTLFCLGFAQTTMLLLAPAPGPKLLSHILQRASNKFRIRAKRVFVAGSGAECDAESIEALVRDGVKLVVSSGAKYEMQSVESATGSPTIVGLSGSDSPLQVEREVDDDDDGEEGRDDDRGTVEGKSVHGDVAYEREELKAEARSEAGSAQPSLDDGKSEEGDGRVLFSSTSASPSAAASQSSSLLSSISSTLASIPSWLPGRSPPPTSIVLPSSLSPPPAAASPSIPIPGRLSAGKDEKFTLSPSPSHSSSSSSSPSLYSSSPVPAAHMSLVSTGSSIASSAASATASSPSPVPSTLSVVDDDPAALLAENAKLREALRSYDDKRRAFRKMEIQLKALQQAADQATTDRERVRELEAAVKDWSERYADSEERFGLQVKANERAVREKDALKAKHAYVVAQLTRAQQTKAELDALAKTHREVVQELEQFRGKNMEEQSLVHLQALLEFHQHMVVRLHSTIQARMDGERKQMEEKWACKICFARSVEVVLQPCNHAVMCSRCAGQVTLCPICRRVINIRTPMHLA